MTENQSQVEGWDKYINNFLKSDDVESSEDAFFCFKVEEADFDGKKSIRLHLERSPDKYLFDLNKSNAVFLKNEKIKTPSEIVGKVLYFEKVLVYNPSLKKNVDGLRIKKVGTLEDKEE